MTSWTWSRDFAVGQHNNPGQNSLNALMSGITKGSLPQKETIMPIIGITVTPQNGPNTSQTNTQKNKHLSQNIFDSESPPPNKFVLFLGCWPPVHHSHATFWILEFGWWSLNIITNTFFPSLFPSFSLPRAPFFLTSSGTHRLAIDFTSIVVSVIGKKIQRKNEEGRDFWTLF